MRVSKAKRMLSAFSIVCTLLFATRASAQCRICDPFLHCIESHMGAVLCVEGPGSCALLLPCFGTGGGGKAFDGPSDDNLTTWTLFDAAPTSMSAPWSARASLRTTAGALALGDEARASLDGAALGGALADAALAHGRDWAIVLVDGAGDGFTLKRTAEGARVRLEVRDVRGNLTGPVLANESLGERDQLTVRVHVDGRERVLVLQAGAVHGLSVASEMSRLRRGLLAAGRALPLRQEPLLRARAQ